MHTIAVSTVILHICSAQVFPFSNLRAFFEPKNKQVRDGVGVSSSGANNASRPHRQSEHDDAYLPALSEFDSPDVFTINRDEDDRRATVKRHPSADTSGRKGSKHRINTHLNTRDSPEDGDGSIFITPKPNHHTEYGSGEEYSKVRTKNRIRKRKPPTIQVEPEVQQSQHVFSDEKFGDFHSGTPSRPSPTTSFSSDGIYVESIPSLSVTIEEDFQKSKSNNGLIDYLVPPKHPSIYDKALKISKSRKTQVPRLSKFKTPPPTEISKLKYPTPTRLSKLKRPAPTGLSKKESHLRPKKPLDPSGPSSDRTTKRHISRRRPSHPREPLRKPTRNPPVEVLMDEQITSETGFTGVGLGAAHGDVGSHGSERVEFQMHGQKGPNSYKFGYDTGKGHNRQFRFEEKDNHGRVRGHYGYYDKDGKLQVVNYEADPHTGFKAETV